MSYLRDGLTAIAVVVGLVASNLGLAADDDAVFFASDDCSGEGYVWNDGADASEVVGIDQRVFVPDPAAAPSEVAYNSRLVPGGCVVQPGSDHLVRAIPKGSRNAF
jgi:hypothetical protein